MEFIDDMYERLLVSEKRTYKEAHIEVFNEKAKIIQDLQRIENGYQLFRKKHPEALENSFRYFLSIASPEDYAKAKRLFKWK